MARHDNPFMRNQRKITEQLQNRHKDEQNNENSSHSNSSEVSDLGNVAQQPENTPVRQQLPKQSGGIGMGRDRMLSSLLSDDEDDEETQLTQAKANSTLSKIATDSEKHNPALAIIENNIKELQKKYSTGGIKSSRYITTDALLAAPADFFDKYEATIKEGSDFVKTQMGNSDRAEIIKRAQDNPTDDAYQDEAYYVLSSYISEFTERSNWRNVHRKIVQAMIINEVLGFGRLEPLWRDKTIDEIMCNGPYDIQVERAGQIIKIPSCRFRDTEHIMGLMGRLFGAINKVVSVTTPIVEGRLHDKSRMNITHTSICPDGPNVNIRRHPEGFWTPQELINFGSAPEEMMKDLGNLVHKGASVLVIGGTGSGKTSLLNSLTGFYKNNARIVTLEDNLEMKPNPKKYLAAPLETRNATSDSDTSITMRDLVKTSLRMRPDVLVVGEVRDDAAYDLSQALNTGHYGASTIHANSAQDAIPRVSSLISQSGLTTVQGSLDMIAAAFDIIVVTKRFAVDGTRKIVAIEEVGKDIINVDNRLTLITRPLWRFVDNGTDENRNVVGHWEHVGNLSKERTESKMLDIQKDLSWEELRELSSLPEGYITHSKNVE